MALNPGVQAAGTAAGGAASGAPGPASIGGLSAPSWDVDTKGLTQLSGKIQQIVKDVGNLDKALQQLDKRLTGIASKSQGAFGGGQQGAGGLTRAGFSGFGGRGGGGSGSGGTGPLAYGAVAEVAAQAAGGINTVMGAVVTGGGPADLMARQSNAIFGGGSAAGTVGTFNQLSNMGTKDLNQAVAQMQANPMLFAKTGSAKQKNLYGFINQLQKLNPNMSAAAATSAANTLASGPALQALQRFGGRNGQYGQGLINPKTMGVNSTNQVFSEMLQTVMGGQRMTPQQMKAMSGQSGYATQQWNLISQNNNVPGMGLGLSPEMLTELRQYAASGGNLSKASKAVQGSPTSSLLKRTTAKTNASDTGYEKSVDTQNAENNAIAKGSGLLANALKEGGPLASILSAFGSVTKGALHAAEALAGIKVLTKALGLGGGGTGTAAGAAEAGGTTLPGGLTVGSAATAGGGTAAGLVGFSGAALVGGLGILSGPAPNASKALSSYRIDAAQSLAARDNGNLSKIRSDMMHGGLFKGVNLTAAEAAQLISQAHIGDPPTGATTTKGMQPSLAKRISAMRAANPKISISSGHRTSQQQRTLYALKGGQGVARPGQSKHQTGQAADLGPPSQFGWIAKNAAKFGLARPAPGSEPWHVESMGDPVTGSSVVSTAMGFAGTPYVWGGGNASGVSYGQPGDSADPNAPNQIGLDCSGLVVAVFGKLHITLPRTSQAQAKVGKAVANLAQALPGDLVFYNYGSLNDHVAIYIGGGNQIAAPHTGLVVQVQPVDKSHLTVIRRIVGSGAGSSAVQAAKAFVGTPSVDAQNHSNGINVGLENTFLSQVASGGVGILGGSGTGAAAAGGAAGAGASAPASSGSTGVTPGSTVLTKQQAYALALGAGMSPTGARTATAIAFVESHFNTNAIDHDKNGSTDYGMWQINSINGGSNALMGPSGVGASASKMAAMTNKGTAWHAWGPDFGESGYGVNPPLGGLPGSKVASALSQLGSLGDPVSGMGDPVGASFSGGGSTASSRPGMSGARLASSRSPINVYMTNQMVSFSQQEAQQMVQMIMAEIQSQSGLSVVSGS